MNAQEIVNLLKIIGMMAGTFGAAYGVSSHDVSALFSNLEVATPAIIAIGSAAWSIYAHWNMKKVPEKSVAILPHTPQDATAPKGYNATGTVVG